MITLSTTLKTLLSQPHLTKFLCLKITVMPQFTYCITTHHSPVSFDGDTYVVSNLLSAMDEPQFTASVDRDLFSMEFDDSTRTLSTMFDCNLSGSDIVVYLCFLNANGVPNTTDKLTVYKGIIDNYSYDFDTSEVGSVKAKITCCNLMASLDAASPYYTSKSALRALKSDDTSFDQLYEGSGNIVLKWGKK